VLLLKDLATEHGGATDDAVKLIGGEAPLVAIVVNAIDDHLSGSDQIALRYTANEIRPLGAILDAAMAAERAVLLIADHGHVPGQAMTSVGARPASGGSRWRALPEGQEPADFEVELPKQAWWPAGAQRVAAIWDETKSYGAPKAGKHGGASLAEVVAPAVLVVPDALAQARPGEVDEELTALPAARLEPDWWACEPPRTTAAAPTPPPKPKRGSKKKPVNEAQLTLGGVTQDPDPAPAPQADPAPAPLPPLLVALGKSPIFREHVEGLPKAHVEEAMRALAIVVEAGDRLGIDQFERKTATPAWRVSSFVSSRLSPVFNFDGYGVIEFDRQGQQLVLSRERLCQLFEVTP
jgi:hypothetical protein